MTRYQDPSSLYIYRVVVERLDFRGTVRRTDLLGPYDTLRAARGQKSRADDAARLERREIRSRIESSPAIWTEVSP